jgi:hypothetical protein
MMGRQQPAQMTGHSLIASANETGGGA